MPLLAGAGDLWIYIVLLVFWGISALFGAIRNAVTKAKRKQQELEEARRRPLGGRSTSSTVSRPPPSLRLPPAPSSDDEESYEADEHQMDEVVMTEASGDEEERDLFAIPPPAPLPLNNFASLAISRGVALQPRLPRRFFPRGVAQAVIVSEILKKPKSLSRERR